MKEISNKIFRAYDIRGIVDKDLDAEWCECFGKACGTYFRQHGIKDCVVGHDCRHSSAEYQAAVANGLRQAGVDVILLGMVATPLLYFGVKTLQRQGGIMITASHNPSGYNGFKVWAGQSTIFGDELQKIYQIMASGEFISGDGVACAHDIVPSYLDAATKDISPARKMKVVLDGGNGAGGLVCAELLRRLGVECVELYCEPDGAFPNHHPDPVVAENMRDLQAKVLAEGADFGLALDGDGDRLGVCDEQGHLLFGDQIVALLARETLRRFPAATIMGDVKCSHQLFRDIEQHGGTPLMWKTGHSLIKAKMQETGAKLAGEMSGHIFFNDRWFGFDDALYSAARFVEIAAQSPVPVSQMLGWNKSFVTPELHIHCPDELKFTITKQAQEYFRARYTISDIDGARIQFADGWGLLRASNTQPVLVLRYEAESEESLALIQKSIEEPLRQWLKDAGVEA